MDKEKLKLILRNMKSLVNALESEIYSDPTSYVDKRENYDDPLWYTSEYKDNDDDDGYPD